MFPDLYVPRSYVLQYLCSPVSMFLGSMFPDPYVPRSYVPRSLCSPIPMFPSTYVPRYLCSPVPIFPEFFFKGGEGGIRSIGTICRQNLKISFLFQDGRHCHLRRFILFTFRQKEVCSITFPMTSRMRTLFLTQSFLSPARQSWGGVGLCPSCCSAVCLSVRVRSRSVDGFCTHTSLRG